MAVLSVAFYNPAIAYADSSEEVTAAPVAQTPAHLLAAERLLRVANVGEQFESLAQQQAREIIYNYSVIINRNIDYQLPVYLERRIAACYREAYQWKFFEDGIAHIIARNFNAEELELLTNFHRNLGMPPGKINLFRNTISKAHVVQQASIDYIFEHSEGCVDQGTELIIQHLQINSVL